jgi:Putative restriction endonuclease
MEFDFKKNPPPDLAVEVDVGRSSVSRQRVYAALGILEVWRFDGELHVLHLQANGQYAERDRSLSFPFLPMARVEAFIHQVSELDENTLIRNFRNWVRKEVLPKYKTRKR